MWWTVRNSLIPQHSSNRNEDLSPAMTDAPTSSCQLAPWPPWSSFGFESDLKVVAKKLFQFVGSESFDLSRADRFAKVSGLLSVIRRRPA